MRFAKLNNSPPPLSIKAPSSTVLKKDKHPGGSKRIYVYGILLFHFQNAFYSLHHVNGITINSPGAKA